VDILSYSAPAAKELDWVFGERSQGETPDERARSSDRVFVRGQAQVAAYKAGATGVQMTAHQVFRAFGFEALVEIAREGSFQLVPARDEPARTLRARREALGLNARQVARFAGLTESQITQAETAGRVSPIRNLLNLAETLALDEQVLGFVPDANGDSELGVRLRTLGFVRDNEEVRLSPTLVLQLAEAAWVIARQLELARLLDAPPELAWEFDYSNDYHSPVYERGYRLAAETRDRLGLGEEDPILNVRQLVERLGIPLIQAEIGQRFAGATVANGEDRGIVVNTEGANTNVWVRRMTICHELGHLLWDPPHQLGKVKVDTYAEIAGGSGLPVETRANAFAISLLAPPRAVERMFDELSDVTTMVAFLMDRFGIGAAAATFHVSNIHKNRFHREIDVSTVRHKALPQPSVEWEAREEWTNAFYPIRDVPQTRRGRFGAYVAKAVQSNLVSLDSAAVWLRTTPDEVRAHLDDMISLEGISSASTAATRS
jgi:transcriptional regulator with XRE-family HTH domain